MEDRTLLPRAIALAATAHAGQLDKAGEPYILHPIRVMQRFESDIVRAVGVLHDVVEDTDVALAQVAQEFGPTVAEAVDALTRREGESYFDFIKRCGRNDIAHQVKCVDLEDNMDLNRIPRQLQTDKDRARNEKYARALFQLRALAHAKGWVYDAHRLELKRV